MRIKHWPHWHLNLQQHAAAHCPPGKHTARQRLKRVVASRAFHIFVLALIISDVLVIFTAIILEVRASDNLSSNLVGTTIHQLFYPSYEYTVLQCTPPADPPPSPVPLTALCADAATCVVQAVIGRPHAVETAITALEYTSVAILSVMVLEIGLTAVAVGRAWLTVLHVFDATVVAASLVIEVVLHSMPDLRQVCRFCFVFVCVVFVCVVFVCAVLCVPPHCVVPPHFVFVPPRRVVPPHCMCLT